MEEEGRAWAHGRRDALRELIRTDPERAIAAALPAARRLALPASIQALLEQPVCAEGAFEISIACGLGEEGHHDATERFTTFGGRRYETFTYGRRLDVTTKRALSVLGVAVDDQLALSDSPVRVIPQEERAARGLADDGIAVEVLGAVQYVADADALQLLEQGLVTAEDVVDPDAKPPRGGESGGPAPLSAYTEGTKTLLYIMCDYPDLTGFPVTVSTVSNAMNAVTTYWDSVSYTRAHLVPTYVPEVLRLPRSGASYTNNFSLLLADARAAATNVGYDADDYDHYVVLTDENSSNINYSYAGKAWVGSPGCHLVDPYYTLRTAGHEIGHNFGLRHANYWRTDSDHPVGRDTVDGGYVTNGVNAEWLEYGHRFSVMSGQSGTDMNDGRAHFAPREKLKLEWITTNEIVVLTNSASVRLYRHDHRDATGTPRAVHIKKTTADVSSYARQYWLGYRMAYTDNGWLQEGVQVDWVQGTTYGQDGAIQLDMTPYSNDDNSGVATSDDNNDKWDGALLLGRTYSDPTNGIHVTPTARGGTAPDQWIDVQVYLGAFPSNRPPELSLAASTLTPATSANVIFTATASDPDGDTLAYAWDFDLPKSLFSNSLNRAQVTNSWSSSSEYVVRCEVSDQMGGRASTSLVVTVGSAGSVYRITGQVLSNGQGVAGVRVYTAHTNMTYTTSDGRYALVDLPSASYTVQAQRYGYSLAGAFSNAVTVGPSQPDRDFGLEGDPAVLLSTTTTLAVVEGGAAVPYVVSLASKPTSTVTVTATTDTNQLQLGGAPVNLAPNDWLHGQTVTVMAVYDASVEADPHGATVSHAASSGDTAYNALAVPTLSVAIAETDFNLPPDVAITSPAPGSVHTEHAAVPVYVQAGDTEGSVTQVVVALNGSPLGTLEGAGLVTWLDAVTGEHTLVATAWDNEGLAATSTPVSVSVLPDLDADGLPDSSDPDDDNDGLSDQFEELHFGGSTNGVPEADDDGDTFVNLAEQLAGTDPTNGASFFHVGSFTTGDSGAVTFDSVTGRLYTLQYCADLLAGNTWSNVTGQVDVPGTGAGLSLSDPSASESRLYRLQVTPPP